MSVVLPVSVESAMDCEMRVNDMFCAVSSSATMRSPRITVQKKKKLPSAATQAFGLPVPRSVIHAGQKCPQLCGIDRSWTRLCRATLSGSVHKPACKRATARCPRSRKTCARLDEGCAIGRCTVGAMPRAPMMPETIVTCFAGPVIRLISVRTVVMLRSMPAVCSRWRTLATVQHGMTAMVAVISEAAIPPCVTCSQSLTNTQMTRSSKREAPQLKDYTNQPPCHWSPNVLRHHLAIRAQLLQPPVRRRLREAHCGSQSSCCTCQRLPIFRWQRVPVRTGPFSL